MYINQTTAAERLIIDSAMDSVMYQLELAERLSMHLFTDYFEDQNQKLDEYAVEVIRDQLYVIHDYLFGAMKEYAMTVGRASFRGVEPHLDGARRAMKTLRVEKALQELWSVERKLPEDQRRAIQEARGKAMELPDDQALPVLDALLKEGTQQ